MIESSFLFAVCQVGSEAWLKRELAARHPELKPAFGRPGFVTFKAGKLWPADAELGSVFARAWGLSFGHEAPRERVESLAARAAASGRAVRLDVLVRGAGAFAELTDAQRELAAHVQRELSATLPASVDGPIATGDLVIDVVVAEDAPERWVGCHVHGPDHAGFRAGLPPVTLPEDAPSRAYLKLEEAVLRFELPVRQGQRAIELGSAPGGATLALVRRGVSVLGVDPGAMDPRVLALRGPGGARVTHLAQPAGALTRAQLPKPTHWLVADMNLAPPVALRYVGRVAGPLMRTLNGAILTLKLNDARAAAALEAHVARVREMGFSRVLVTQLPSNRREVCVVGLNDAPVAKPATSRR